eukprot:3590340-Rhodomonas_salina.3
MLGGAGAGVTRGMARRDGWRRACAALERDTEPTRGANTQTFCMGWDCGLGWVRGGFGVGWKGQSAGAETGWWLTEAGVDRAEGCG